jgi:hypothetical protein
MNDDKNSILVSEIIYNIFVISKKIWYWTNIKKTYQISSANLK